MLAGGLALVCKGYTPGVSDQSEPEKKGFLDGILGGLGFGKPAAKPAPRAAMGSDQLQRSPRATAPMPAAAKATAPLSEQEKAKQSEERRYLIAAFEATPALIPEFQNPQYMYKLISNERDYVQERLNKVLADRKKLASATDAEDPGLDRLDARIQEYRNDLTRLFLLIKRVAGVQRSGTGGTDFLDPLKRD